MGTAASFVRRLPEQSGKTVVVTGASGGIGLEACAQLAAKGARVVMAVRDVGKGERARDEAVATAARLGGKAAVTRDSFVLVQLDVSDLTSVRGFRERLLAAVPGLDKVDVLILNAGIMAPPERSVSKDGLEMQMATNVFGHFALAALLFDLVKASSDGRIVSVASGAHWGARTVSLDDLTFEKGYSPMGVYSQTKLCNILFTFKLQRLLDEAGVTNVRAFAVHPGITHTKLFDHNAKIQVLAYIGQSPAMGATPTVLAAADPRPPKRGSYAGPWFFDYVGLASWGHATSPAANSKKLQDALWAKAMDVTKTSFAGLGGGADDAVAVKP